MGLGESRDWEATELLDLPDLQLVLDKRVESGVYQVQTHRVTSIAPPVPPPSEQRRPLLRSSTRGLRSVSALGQRENPEESDTGEPMDVDQTEAETPSGGAGRSQDVAGAETSTDTTSDQSQRGG